MMTPQAGGARSALTTTTAPAHTALASFEDAALPYMNELYRIASRTLGKPTEAEDIVQEVYLQAWKSFHNFTPGTNCRAWLFKIMFHLIGRHWRKGHQMMLVGEESAAFEQLAAVPTTPTELQDEEILAALAALPEPFRVAILLADVQEFDYKEIAQVLDIPIGTVMSRVSRGRKLLRQQLAPPLRAGRPIAQA